ncbi:hypothetical protein Taro_003499 [Colocasia esculenta]|uniref:Mitochondrial glycoprotein n=1 Tax=Colocasia esculenta TaxID=4460 RepID=A0A843TLS9_COLES|nr:hypothetical protein [Colocasia esculenta]
MSAAMAGFLRHTRMASLFSPSRLQALIWPLSSRVPPRLSRSSPSAAASGTARGYIAKMRRSAFQENLLRILRTEIDYEIDVRPPQELVQKFKSFAVEDRPGERWITLRGKYGEDEIKVDVTMFDYAIPVPGDAKTEESGGENMKLHISLVVDVGKDPALGPVLQFICSAWPDALEIEHLHVVQYDRPVSCPFMGPRFKDMDDELQEAMQEYLEKRGVDDELAVFLHQYMMNKDRREYVRWMEIVKSYVEK